MYAALYAGGALYATPYAGCCGRRAQFQGFDISVVAVFSLQSAAVEGARGARGDVPCATLYAGDCGGWALFARGGGDALCATLYAKGVEGELSLGVSKFLLWQFSQQLPSRKHRSQGKFAASCN